MRGFKRGAKPPKAKNYADGGKVNGPGTGISDDVQAQVPGGSYVMPADSTEQIGSDQLQAMGQGAAVDVNLSDGEQVMPPEQVHAIGVQTLDVMKGATHTPAAQQDGAKGFKPGGAAPAEPELFFADGGLVEDERKKSLSASGYSADPTTAQVQMAEDRAAQRIATQPQGNNPERAARMQAQVRQPVTDASGAVVQPQKLPASGFTPQYRTEGSGHRTDTMLRGTSDDVADAWGKGEYARGAGTLVRGTLATIPAAIADAGEDVYNVAGKPVVGFGEGLLGIQSAEAAAAAPAATPTAATVNANPVPAPVGTAAPGGAPTGALDAAAKAAPPASGYQQTGIAGVVGKRGANGVYEFSNDEKAVAGAGNAPLGFKGAGAEGGPSGKGGTFSVISGGQEGMQRNLRAADIMSQGRGFAPGGGVTVVGDSSRGDAAARAALTAASTPYRNSPGSQLTANQLRTLTGMQESQDRNALGRETNATNLVREQLQQEGANARAAASNNLDQQRTAAELETRGFQNRAAQRLESLYQQYDLAPPEQRSALAEQIRVLSGKDAANRFTVVPGGQEYDPQSMTVVTRPSRVINNQTGQFIEQGEAASPTPPQNHIDALKKNPDLATQFDAIYGRGAAARYLGAK